MKSLSFVMVTTFSFVLLFLCSGNCFAGQLKTDICHINRSYDFGGGPVDIGRLINIADPAYQSHIKHGDPEVWTIVTLSNGSEVCTADMVVECPCWDEITIDQYVRQIVNPICNDQEFPIHTWLQDPDNPYNVFVMSSTGWCVLYDPVYNGNSKYPINTDELASCREILINSEMWKINCIEP
jgi:hypothetical protein